MWDSDALRNPATFHTPTLAASVNDDQTTTNGRVKQESKSLLLVGIQTQFLKQQKVKFT